MEDLKYWIWLSRLEKINVVTKNKLINNYKTPKNIWSLDKNQLSKITYLNKKDIEEILKNQYKENLEKYIEYMKKNEISIITIYDKEYPNNLKNIYDYPLLLFIKGNTKILNKFSLGIVGCRQCSIYGKEVSRKISYNLSKLDINIISGLAKGIDSHAHIGCMESKGKTIAVLGSGLDNIYPKENEYLANNIIKNGGTIISEYIMGTKPIKTNFPARNRLISGISNGIIVVEAKQKSGSLITADFALEQGKNVFAIPGNIYNMNSQGTNNLIKEGAKIVTNIKDILEEYKFC